MAENILVAQLVDEVWLAEAYLDVVSTVASNDEDDGAWDVLEVSDDGLTLRLPRDEVAKEHRNEIKATFTTVEECQAFKNWLEMRGSIIAEDEANTAYVERTDKEIAEAEEA